MKDSKPKPDLWILLGAILVIAVLIIGLTCQVLPSSDRGDSTEPAAESPEESEDLEEENAKQPILSLRKPARRNPKDPLRNRKPLPQAALQKTPAKQFPQETWSMTRTEL